MCVLNPRDRRLTISVLNSIFFPLKSSLSKRIIVGSENSTSVKRRDLKVAPGCHPIAESEG